MLHLMPTQNPRINVTVKPSTFAKVQELSRITGNSMSAIVAEILEHSEPVFERLVRVLVLAEQAKTEALDKLHGDMQRAQARVETQLGLAMDEFDSATGSLIDTVETIRRRAPRGAAEDAHAASPVPRRARPTPISNRGVRYATPSTKVHTNSKKPRGVQ
jgi:hypothetical protein